MKKIKIFLISLSLLPVLVYAAPTITDTKDYCKDIGAPFKSIGQIFNWASCTIIKTVIPFFFTLATAAFIWGVIQYVINAENEEKRKNGKTFMIWGLIALFVMISLWGLVNVLTNTFGFKTLIPQLSQ